MEIRKVKGGYIAVNDSSVESIHTTLDDLCTFLLFDYEDRTSQGDSGDTFGKVTIERERKVNADMVDATAMANFIHNNEILKKWYDDGCETPMPLTVGVGNADDENRTASVYPAGWLTAMMKSLCIPKGVKSESL